MKLVEAYIFEAKCPTCGTEGAYHGFSSIECPNKRCRHYNPNVVSKDDSNDYVCLLSTKERNLYDAAVGYFKNEKEMEDWIDSSESEEFLQTNGISQIIEWSFVYCYIENDAYSSKKECVLYLYDKNPLFVISEFDYGAEMFINDRSKQEAVFDVIPDEFLPGSPVSAQDKIFYYDELIDYAIALDFYNKGD